ncbi:MAG: helix-turn-helix transcriptional regulator [Rhodoferax sp.]|uniref:helix-turn-helix domain-containing protein n=1 Tax=Rhodoferax sp. TaxID=50421 RepID=UPI0032676A65
MQVMAFAGISQAECARRLSMSPSFLSDVLKGAKRPGAEFMLAIKTTLGVSVDWLLTGAGNMTGGMGVQHELLKAIRLQIAVAKAAVLQDDAMAKALVLLIREGQLAAAQADPGLNALLERLAPMEADLDLAVELYNGHLWASDPVTQRRNLMAAATAHFEARKPMDAMASITGTFTPRQQPEQHAVLQVNSGKDQRIAGRDYKERKGAKK